MARVGTAAAVLLALATTAVSTPAFADDDNDDDTPAPPPKPPPPPPFSATPFGYVEASYSYNFNRPSNGITNFRGFDNRHNTFTLDNVAIGANWQAGDSVSGRLTLQVGNTPSTYYGLNEPSLQGANGANASSSELWKYIQEAYVGWRAPIGDGLLVQFGLFLSPIGIETMAIKDSWNWSRSNLFFGLPFYHSGLRATYPVSQYVTAGFHLYNGWNDVEDNNEEKSVAGTIAYNTLSATDADLLKVNLAILYFGGVERPTGDPAGPWWRHDFDAVAQWDITTWLSIAGEGNFGWEPNRFSQGGSAFGTSWYAGALYARAKTLDWLYVALRGDGFWENVASNASGSASPIFWPAGTRWVSSGTATLDARPVDHISMRLEYRHDEAGGPMFFSGDVPVDSNGAYISNAVRQDTITLGATTWF
jgi:hypothetical protein